MDVIYGVSLIGRVIVTAIVGRSLVVVAPSVRNSSLVVLPFFLCPLPAQEEIENGAKDIHPARHGCQMAIARFLDRMCMVPSGFWTVAPLRYTAKLDPFLSLDCTSQALHPGAIQGNEGIKFCYLATLNVLHHQFKQ